MTCLFVRTLDLARSRLSTTEWQNFALARAYMRDAQLLILDEPTATLDALISHRFSTVRMAGRILVLADGSIREQGSHEQLLGLGGRYAEIIRATGCWLPLKVKMNE